MNNSALSRRRDAAFHAVNQSQHALQGQREMAETLAARRLPTGTNANELLSLRDLDEHKKVLTAIAAGVGSSTSEAIAASLLPLSAVHTFIQSSNKRWGFGVGGIVAATLPTALESVFSTEEHAESLVKANIHQRMDANYSLHPLDQHALLEATKVQLESMSAIAGVVANLAGMAALVEDGIAVGAVTGLALGSLGAAIALAKKATSDIESLRTQGYDAVGPEGQVLGHETFDMASLDKANAQRSADALSKTHAENGKLLAAPILLAAASAITGFVLASTLLHKVKHNDGALNPPDLEAPDYQAGQVFPAAVNLYCMAKALYKFAKTRYALPKLRAAINANLLRNERLSVQQSLVTAFEHHHTTVAKLEEATRLLNESSGPDDGDVGSSRIPLEPIAEE